MMTQTRWVLPEINAPQPGGIMLVGRDPGYNEMQQGRPFVGEAGKKLNDMLSAAGISRQHVNVANVVGVQPPQNEFHRHSRDDVDRGMRHLTTLLAELRPNVVVAMGNEAAYALVAEWPTRGNGIYGATGIADRRGYLWQGRHGGKVLTALHPSAVMRDVSGITEMLTVHDLTHAAAEATSATLTRPPMHIEIVDSHAAAQVAMVALRLATTLAADIEISNAYPYVCSCVGLAASADVAYVFTPATLAYAYALLEDASITKIFQNGQFDIHFLLSRHNVRVAGPLDDTIVMWHTRWPEIAGAGVDLQGNKRKSGAKRTRKSLAFFASLYGNYAWWKDYAFESEHDKYMLNGQDCCITFKVATELRVELADMALSHVYAMTMRRVWPCVEMQRNGVLVNEGRRLECVATLEQRASMATAEVAVMAKGILEAARGRLAKPHLIWERHVCPCCRNGKSMRSSCVNCLGLSGELRKPQLQALCKTYIISNGHSPQDKAALLQALPRMTIAQMRAMVLKPCVQCSGAGSWEEYAFNAASNEQMHMLLFDALKLPRRSSVDESSLKGLLGWLSEMQSVPASADEGAP